jgi:hypothetical protein
MKTEPGQMENLYGSGGTLLGYAIEKVAQRLDALVLVLKTCTGRTYSMPWEELHQDGSVKSLKDAVDAKYNAYYAGLPRVGVVLDNGGRGYWCWRLREGR